MPRSKKEDWVEPESTAALSNAEIITTYNQLVKQNNQINWRKGDLALQLSIQAQRGTGTLRGDALVEAFLELTGESENTFTNLRWVANAYPPGPDREIAVPWTHFRIAAPLPESTRRVLLHQAAAEKWTTRQMTEAVKAAQVEGWTHKSD